MNENDIYKLTELIKIKIDKDLASPYLTGQLKRSVRIDKCDGGFRIVIDPRTYNLMQYLKKGVMIYGHGSYASEVDIIGSFANNHRYYVRTAVLHSIRQRTRRYRKYDMKVIRYGNFYSDESLAFSDEAQGSGRYHFWHQLAGQKFPKQYEVTII